MATSNLGILHIAAGQNQKEVTANAGLDELDAALCGLGPIAMTDADKTLTPLQALGALVFVFTGALTADRNVLVPVVAQLTAPATGAKLYIVNNSTTGGHNLTVKTASGTGIAVAAADGYVLLYCDGTNVVKVKAL